MTLIERLEAAEVGSRELSQLVLCETIAPPGSWVEQSPFNGAWVIYSSRAPDGRARLWEARGDDHQIKIASVSESLDAALALAERLNLNGPLVIHRNGPAEWGVTYVDDDTVYAPTPALALCIAILKAKETK